MHNIIVHHPKDLTIDWAQRVVNQHNTDIVVSGVDITSVDIATTTRIRIKVEHNEPSLLPEQWFVKLPSMAWQARLITALPRLLHTEVRFYNEVAHSVSVTVPHFLAAQSKLGRGATLVLTDVTEFGAIPGSPGDALTLTQATRVVEQLAKFHACFWNKGCINHSYPWLAGPVRSLEDFLGTAMAVPLMKRGLQQAGELVPFKLYAQAIHYARNRRQAMRFLTQAQQTLVHHDCHPGNIFWNQSQPGLLDWQLIRFSEGISDIAYFLSVSLNTETRRLHEASLIAIYAQCLQDNGIAGIDVNILQQRYRAHLIYPFEAMIITLAIGGMMNLQSNHELIRRTAAAIEDLDAFSAIPL
ncbi:ecdysteroid 22-kinase family protein [Methylobacter psychrophilus]|uniref:ecdysteroid 22-kinase family protein n=1 Tax=Methylobacter psychrophilus TaxID=96941 RepID=UPI0021D51BCF|nr:ecdysteroid 22-kinase family protein [Methylobacter psychrophilus]